MVDVIRPMTIPPQRALSQHAARALRDAILAGRYGPGARLIERELADEMGVSRAPVREALWLLSKEGLVTLNPHRGATVSPVSTALVIDVFSVRIALEGMAARLATAHLGPDALARMSELIAEMDIAGQTGDAALLVDLDIEFHRVLTAACERPVLLDALETVWNRSYLLISASRSAFPLADLADLHAPLLEAARSGSPDRVAAEVREHLRFGERILLDHFGGPTEL